VRIFVLFNCPFQGIQGALQALLPSSEVIGFGLGAAPTQT